MTFNLDRRWARLAVSFLFVTVLGFGGRVSSEETPEAGTPPPESRPAVAIESSNPLSGNAEAIRAGKELYYKWCTACHGLHADGVSRFGSYAADLRHFWRGYKQFVVIVQNGRPEKQMPPWKEVLDEAQISQVGAFLETLSSEGAVWK